ncbi:MAG: hypothetical protein IJY47_04065 [Clostridia bacterium]|nr:hypothetical protein [Clostridia bacterium]
MKQIQAKHRFLALSLVAVLLLSFLISCSKKGDRFGTDEQGRTMNEKTGVVYQIAPDCYAPIQVEEDVYGSSASNVYHAIVGADPTDWLYGELGMLLYAEDVVLPSLNQMKIDRIGVYDSSDSRLGELTDTAVIENAVSGYLEGENHPYSGLISPLAHYTLRFEDSSLGICYVVNYLEYAGESEEERVFYLYCRSAQRFVPVSDSLRNAVESVIGAE